MNRIKTEYLLKGLSLLGYDAINLCDRDFSLGGKFLTAMQSKYRLPFVSANIYYQDRDKLFVQSHIVKHWGGKKSSGRRGGDIKIGILGVTSERRDLINPDLKESPLEAKNPVQVAAHLVPELRKKCDLIVVLAHLVPMQTQSLAEQVPGIDVIITGGSSLQAVPQLVNGCLILQSESQGKYVGDLQIQLDEGKNKVSHAGSLVPLDEKLPDDTAFVELVTEYKEALKKMTQTLRTGK